MTMITRRSLVLGSLAAPLARSALAQTGGNITRIIVPFPPGGTVDPIARMVQPGLQQRLGTTVGIENKPGASGSLGHLTMVLLSQRAGVKMVHVPYRGGGPLMNDALAGHIDLAIGSAALITPQVKGGKLRGLMQTSAKRVPGLPDVPTVIESGFPDF